jgi:hypothetical protein
VAWQKVQKETIRKALQAGPTGMINAFSQYNQMKAQQQQNAGSSTSNVPNMANVPSFNSEMFGKSWEFCKKGEQVTSRRIHVGFDF